MSRSAPNYYTNYPRDVPPTPEGGQNRDGSVHGPGSSRGQPSFLRPSKAQYHPAYHRRPPRGRTPADASYENMERKEKGGTAPHVSARTAEAHALRAETQAQALRASVDVPEQAHVDYPRDVAELAQLAKSLRGDPRSIATIVREIEKVAQEEFASKNVHVLPIGSAGSGLGGPQSDVDVVIYNPADVTGNWNERKACSQRALGQMRKALKRRLRWQDTDLVRRARVPVLKMRNRDGREIDITYNNLLPLYNTALLREYVRQFPPLADLVRLVRHWAKLSSLHGAADGFFSSYSWALLTVFVMQLKRGLPSLQALAEEEEEFIVEDNVVSNVAFAKPTLPEPAATKSEEGAVRLEELLKDFFGFYGGEFGGIDVVSIRLGRLADMSDPELRKMHRPFVGETINLEDPFDYSIKSGAVKRRNLAVTLRRPKEILARIRESWRKLQKGDTIITIFVQKCIGCGQKFPHDYTGSSFRGKMYCVDCWDGWRK